MLFVRPGPGAPGTHRLGGTEMKGLLSLAIGSLVLLAACGAPVAGAATGGAVRATLTDTAIALDHPSVSAGQVVFNVKNAGTVVHELVVIKTTLAADQIPADIDEPGKVHEEGSKGESGDVEAGKTASFTLNLDPGTYVLICNEAGHYAIGMRIAFQVTK